MSHSCKYFIVHCIDFRLQQKTKEFMEKEGLLGNCDVVSVAGAVKNIDFVLEQIGISVRLHGMKEVILLNHTDCGAYGGSSKFSSAQEERDFYIVEMEKAKVAILGKYPNLLVKMMLAKILPSGEVDIEHVG